MRKYLSKKMSAYVAVVVTVWVSELLLIVSSL